MNALHSERASERDKVQPAKVDGTREKVVPVAERHAAHWEQVHRACGLVEDSVVHVVSLVPVDGWALLYFSMAKKAAAMASYPVPPAMAKWNGMGALPAGRKVPARTVATSLDL